MSMLTDLEPSPSATYKWGVSVFDRGEVVSLGFAKTQKEAVMHARRQQNPVVHISRRYEQWELTLKALK